jgi:hypothetical protein
LSNGHTFWAKACAVATATNNWVCLLHPPPAMHLSI